MLRSLEGIEAFKNCNEAIPIEMKIGQMDLPDPEGEADRQSSSAAARSAIQNGMTVSGKE